MAGEAVEIPDWCYPAVFDMRGGVRFDTYEGRWGDEAKLGRLLQAYAVNRTRIEAQRTGHSLRETALPGGRIKLILTPPETLQQVSA